ncbi:integrase family protein [Microvirgula aerodenitrificans]|uniref:tyrosine-type recombinase/integrase n=1 Tax=Microvirgula aerodenitrificans TaxID=57480 RepID=UPI002F40F355
MAKVNFTAARVSGHSCPEGKSQAFIWDSKSPGLGLRATAAGAKSYVFQGKIQGKTVRVTIGDPRSWMIEQAQEEARRLQRLIDAGVDPRTEREERVATEALRRAELVRQEVTVREVWKVYLAARKAKWSERHYLDHEHLADPGGRNVKRGKGQIVAGPLAELMPLLLSELTRERVDGWLEAEVAKRPARTRLAFSLLRAFVSWCNGRPEYTGMASLDICTNKQLKEHLPKPQTKGDCLQREQLPAWFAAVRDLQNPVISTYLQALLITGARREEMAALKWNDVDFQWRSLSISDKVEESGRVIPLTPYIAHLLSVLPRRNEWVFSSPAAADGKIAEPRIAHNQALAEAGLPHLTLHGLRRSFGTLTEWIECPTGIVAQIMGHKPSAIAEKHYRRRPLDLLRMWHDKIETWILEQAGIDTMQ